MNKTVIECNGIAAGYVKGLNILQGIDMIINEKEIVSIIGPNGAGKSTLIKQIVGSVKHDIGSIILDQEDITDLTDVERAKIGISRTFQVSSIIPQFSAIDNIVLSLLDKSSKTFQLFKSVRNNKELYSNAKKILKEIELLEKSDISASDLSHGDRSFFVWWANGWFGWKWYKHDDKFIQKNKI